MTQPCERYEHEALPLIEAGQPLTDPHFNECPDCLRAAQQYGEIMQALRVMHQNTPSGDWQARVLAEIAQAEQAKAKTSSRWLPLAAAVAVVALSAPFIKTLVQEPVLAPLVVTVEHGEGVFRSRDAVPGDTLHIGGGVQQLSDTRVRIYRDSQLIYECGKQQLCEGNKNNLKLSFVLEKAGNYQVLVVSGAGDTNFTAGELDADVLKATDNGLEITLLGPLPVL